MPENQNIEWKSKWKDDYLTWICGFANAQGGSLYIGCDDDGHVVGLEKYYYRSGSTMQTLSGPELESFILRKRGASWRYYDSIYSR